jgi:fructoselysine 6-phosphate deglycase
MAEKNKTFDRFEFISQFEGALRQIEPAKRLGNEFADQAINRIFFAGCGAPYYLMRSLAYWGQKIAINTEIRTCYAAELVNQDPLAIDKNTLVILGSHSGTTKETLEAAKFLKSKPCKTMSITQEELSPLGQETMNVLPYGKTSQGYFSSYILAQTLFSAFLNSREKGWPYHSSLMESLPSLPNALADAKEENLSKAAVQANILADQNLLYVVGAGPMFTTAFVFASCFLMEMQWMHAHALTAADFFHGPFEVVDKSTPLIVLIGEDPSQPEAERVKKFCEEYAGQSIVYDSRNFEMAGISALARPIVAPFIIDAALTGLVEELTTLRDHPLTTRRYMGKVDY